MRTNQPSSDLVSRRPSNVVSSQTVRVLIAIVLILAGIILLLIPYSGVMSDLVSKIGLALVVAGTVSLFHEVILKRLEGEETAMLFSGRVEKILLENPLYVSGIRLISPVRRGLEQYYYWTISTDPQQMYFAGRSVLHRIEADLYSRGLGPVEEIIARRLSEGATIHIMFLNPKSSIVPRLANEEGQSREDFVANIATTIGICEKLYAVMKDRAFAPEAELHVQMYDEIPYFAYHAVDDSVILGFYFASALGHATAAYEVLDVQTKEFFRKHFDALFARSESVLQLSRRDGRATFNNDFVSGIQTLSRGEFGQGNGSSVVPGRKAKKKRGLKFGS